MILLKTTKCSWWRRCEMNRSYEKKSEQYTHTHMNTLSTASGTDIVKYRSWHRHSVIPEYSHTLTYFLLCFFLENSSTLWVCSCTLAQSAFASLFSFSPHLSTILIIFIFIFIFFMVFAFTSILLFLCMLLHCSAKSESFQNTIKSNESFFFHL